MFDMAQFKIILPEIIVLTMACIILLVDRYTSDSRRGRVHMLSILTLVFAALATLRSHQTENGVIQTMFAFSDTFVRDQMGDVLKLFVYLVIGGVLIYSKTYLRDRNIFKGEFHLLVLFGTLGMMIMISAANFVSLYLGLELLALSTYALVAFDRDDRLGSESAMKYFILGSIASGMLLYGMSMVYGATGSLQLSEVAAAVSNPRIGEINLILAFGLVFIVAGLAFKLGAVPFHMWLPDVYHGSPTAVTTFMAGAPKLAAFAMAIRLLEDALGGMHMQWQGMLIFLAILSLIIGNVVAIAQSNIKRMLAYSTISHVGFLLLGLIAGTPEGYEASMFYAIVYAITSVGAFGMLVLLSRKGYEADQLDDFKGLNQRDPWYAGLMLAFMGSLAGFPPFVGFWAKLYVIQAAVGVGLVWLAAFAVVFAVIGAFYYLRVIKLMYMDRPEEDREIDAPWEMRALLAANGITMLILFIFPGALTALVATAF